MNLRDYMHFNHLTDVMMAKKLGVHRCTFNTIKHKKIPCSVRLAKKIEDLTNGQVTIQELMQK